MLLVLQKGGLYTVIAQNACSFIVFIVRAQNFNSFIVFIVIAQNFPSFIAFIVIAFAIKIHWFYVFKAHLC